MFGKIKYPIPGYPIRGIMPVPKDMHENKGRLFCRHEYVQCGFHADVVDNLEISVRHYRCEKCGRLIWVDGRVDDLQQEKIYDSEF